MSAINDQHKAFSRAVVALAREHKMDNLKVQFRQGSGQLYLREDITFSWSEGRHGDRSNILLECRAAIGIEETATPAEGSQS